MQRFLAGRKALVTGSSSGIGAAIATTLATAGADVAINYCTNEAGAKSVAAKVEAAGSRAVVLAGDVTRLADCQRIVAETVAELGGIDILINNVGVFAYKKARDHTAHEFERIIAGTLNATFHCSMAALVHMRQAGWGRIVNLGAQGAERAGARVDIVPHMAGKAGVVALSRGLAVEEGPYGITVNVVCPGWIKDVNLQRQQALTMVDADSPVGRPGTSQDVADAVLYLVSPQASFVNGAVIAVSGGWQL
jgi:3-oxoacyl-[acyl-carrier protein] reductase